MNNKLVFTAFAIFTIILIQAGCKTGKAEPVSLEGYTTTPSGLQYKVEVEGTGKKPIEWDLIEVHYEGKLLDGTIFDSSYEKKKTFTFGLSRVIAGWTEGIQLMKEGAIYHFIIPSDLAYGDKSAGSLIAPNSTLYFKVELIDVK
jgi:FKBP-type peptidyl-prolyl cis-trans isomerase FkpA